MAIRSPGNLHLNGIDLIRSRFAGGGIWRKKKMIWVRKLKNGPGRFQGKEIPETWSPVVIDEKKLQEAANYMEISKTEPAEIKDAREAAELKRKFKAGEIKEIPARGKK